jgi:hydroxymethylpyrimidine pyrophosphatase-like HAD family hydrolase
VIGDHLNDLAMFEIAGLTAAVANAHPQTLSRASLVVSSNDHNGVAELLGRLTLDPTAVSS